MLQRLRPFLFVFSIIYASLAQGLEFDVPQSGNLLITQKATSLKALWWNIAGLSVNKKALATNLSQLTHSPSSPDIFIFAEAPKKLLKLQLPSSFYKKFRHQKHFPYSPGANKGLLVLSRYPIRTVSHKALRPFNLKKLRDEARFQTDFWKRLRKNFASNFRPAIHLQIKKRGQIHNIYATHLLNPWFSYLKSYNRKFKKTSSWSKMAVRFKLFLNMQNEAYNPLVYQAILFRIFLDKAFPKALPHQTHLVLGDFNAPDRTVPDNFSLSFLAQPSLAYVFLSARLNKILDHHYTIPTLDYLEKRKNNPHITSKKPFFMVDHAFTWGSTVPLTARVLPLKGSDHYPIFAEIEHKP